MPVCRLLLFRRRPGEKVLPYSWPGNARDYGKIHRTGNGAHSAMNGHPTVEDLPEKIRNYRSDPVLVGSHDPAELLPMEEVERRYIQHVLNTVGGNKTTASRILGLDRKTLYRNSTAMVLRIANGKLSRRVLLTDMFSRDVAKVVTLLRS